MISLFQDMSDMQNKLAKLKALSKDDKTENALLRSRIDEQSQLIMILKQRSDEHYHKAKTLERINDELELFRTRAQEQIDNEIKRFNILDGRFNDLASNHEELIKIKDEYKRNNEHLRRENLKLRDENAKLFSKAIEERDEKIKQLDDSIETLKGECSQLKIKNRFVLFNLI